MADLFVGETVDGRMEAVEAADVTSGALVNRSTKMGAPCAIGGETSEMKWKPVIVKELPDETVEAQCYPFAKVYAEIPAKD